MKAQILLAYLAPHLHGGAAGFVLILFFLVAAIALILTAVSMDKGKWPTWLCLFQQPSATPTGS